MHPWPSCNGRTRNAVSMSIWVCTRPHYFYCASPDFTTSIVSQSVTNNRCAPSCGGHKRKVRGHIKKISAGAWRRHCAPSCKLLPTPLWQWTLHLVLLNVYSGWTQMFCWLFDIILASNNCQLHVVRPFLQSLPTVEHKRPLKWVATVLPCCCYSVVAIVTVVVVVEWRH